jgi:branched-chain amino acid transport system permease protein
VTYIFPGLVIGALYALLGNSITFSYSTTGILNLATGAIAYVAADMYYRLVSVDGWYTWGAAAMCILVLSPALGLVMWAGVFRRLERSDLVVQMVATIGLAVALPSLMQLVLPNLDVAQTPGLIPGGLRSVTFGFIHANRDQLVAVGGAAICIVGLYLLVERTRFGLNTRAVVDRSLLAETRGISTLRTSAISWIVATMMTGMAGILLSPLITLDPAQYSQLTVAALGVALVGRFRNLLPTAAAGLGLGVAASLLTGYAPAGSLIGNGLVPSLPFFLLAGMLLIGRLPLTSRQDVVEGPSAAVAKTVQSASSASLVSRQRRVPVFWKRGILSLLAVAALVLALFGFNAYWTGVIAEGTAFSVLFLSFSVATGEGGVLCLGQAALAAAGAFVAGRLATEAGVPVVVAVIVGVIASATAGGLLGVLGARLDQVGFALITLAFALFCDQFAFNNTSLVPLNGVKFPGVKFAGLAPTQSQIVLGVVIFAVLAGVLAVIRRGRTGRAYAAMRGNPVSTEGLGVNVRAMRVGVFALGSGIAGLGGILLGTNSQLLGPTDFSLAFGLVWVAVVVTVGVRGFMGALVAGLVYTVVPAAFALIHISRVGNLPPVLFGLGAVGLAQEPRGVLAQWRAAGRALAVCFGSQPYPQAEAAPSGAAHSESPMTPAGESR